MATVDVQGTFVSEKVSRVRWIPEEYGESHCFLTGSWDNERNYVRLWRLEEEAEGDGPAQAGKWRVAGGVTQMAIAAPGLAAVACSRGALALLALPGLRPRQLWPALHRFGGEPAACTGIAAMDGDLVTVGEDGRINCLTCLQPQVIRTIENADSCTLHCVCFLKHNEIITGNLRGQMKIWDLRSPADNPSSTFAISNDQIAATCIVNHPTQRHLVLAGSENGSVAVWDLRVNTYPASFLNAHSAAIGEIQFHPDHPQRLFTCSASGEIWHWNTATMSKHITSTANSMNESSINPWLMSDEDKSNLEIVSLMSDLHKPINSLDCNKNRVICGCDNEAIYIIDNIFT